MKAADRFKDPPTRVNELWQTDFSYLKVVHWGWYYLTTILDDYSRYIITWELCKNMRSDDVERVVTFDNRNPPSDQFVLVYLLIMIQEYYLEKFPDQFPIFDFQVLTNPLVGYLPDLHLLRICL